MKQFKEQLQQLLLDTQEREGIIISEVDIKAIQSTTNDRDWYFERHKITIIIG